MSEDEIWELKRTARKRARHMLLEMHPKRREEAALDAALRLSNIWGASECLLAYMASGLELDCAPAIQLALDEKKKVFIPRTFDGGGMVFFRILSAEGPFVEGPFGIREPAVEMDEDLSENCVWKPGEGLTLVLTPGILFDGDGGRLGRGGGYFDRFIRKFRPNEDESDEVNPLFIGYAYDEQLVEKVPRGSGDELLDGVLTNLRFLRKLPNATCSGNIFV